ncbi:MAG: hypothetical protein PHY02_09495 [Phycisphaerae bacterium]|nr:hypothetical protein [Phycisphaerae bacterium]
MFTIDLLKGRGIPPKNRPWGAAVVGAAFAMPVLVALVMLGFYVSNRIVIKVAKQEIVNYDKYIVTLSDAVEMQKSFEAEKNNIDSCLSEVFSSISEHTQWSPVLAILAENMPSSMVLTNLEVRQHTVNKKVPQKDNPAQTVEISVPVRTLRMSVSGRPQSDNDEAVRDFKDRLRLSALLAPRLEDIIVSQKSGTFEGQSVVSYEIDCIFKPEL